MRYASTRRLSIQRLWSLAVVPYLLLALFGEGLHSHPLFSEASQSTALTSASHFDGSATLHINAPRDDHHHAAECLACAWSAQSTAQIVAVTHAPSLLPSSVLLAASPRPLLSSRAALSRNRGPPSI